MDIPLKEEGIAKLKAIGKDPDLPRNLAGDRVSRTAPAWTWHPAMCLHNAPEAHPERSGRTMAVRNRIILSVCLFVILARHFLERKSFFPYLYVFDFLKLMPTYYTC